MVSTNVSSWLKKAQAELKAAAIATARLEALVLLEDALGMDRAQLLAQPEMKIPDAVQNVLSGQIVRRAEHEPLAYIRGKSEFYGREFVVSAAVLEPRPESETMIELLKSYFLGHSSEGWNPINKARLGRSTSPGSPLAARDDNSGNLVRIADVGAGSGALGITAWLELSKLGWEAESLVVDLLEIDDAAIEVAKTNVINFATGQVVLQCDLLQPLAGNNTQKLKSSSKSAIDYDALLCNLPYVPDSHTINAAALHEPKIAIFGGPDGLDVYRQLFEQIQAKPKLPLLILTESLPPQHEELTAIARAAGYQLQAEDDFIQLFYLEK